MARAAAPPVARRRSWFWLQGLACGVLATTAAPLALMVAVLLAPIVLATLARSPQNAGSLLPRIMLIYGLAAAIPTAERLWAAAQSWPASLDLLADIRVIGLIWGAQGAGWLMAQLAPLSVRIVLEARVTARAVRLGRVSRRIQDEWGLQVEPGAADGPRERE